MNAPPMSTYYQPRTIPTLLVIAVATLITGATTLLADNGETSIEFNRDIRPILANHCYHCHGPDAKTREADLRLDTQAGFTEQRDPPLIIQHQPASSELIHRITSTDSDLQMPPPDSNRNLNAAQINLLTRWIQQGANYSGHWSLQPLVKPAVPQLKKRLASFSRNPLDQFILAKLQSTELQPSTAAPATTLLRRVTLDLTGLPPTPIQTQAFLANPTDEHYEQIVDNLLAQPEYGEHFAWNWLVAARYSDTNGYQGDRTRTSHFWRTWVINAFNDNMPFNQFTVEQLAGDLLESPTLDQRIATGFNRNHPLNGEGGRIAEESRVEYVFDRTETTGTVWLGLTVGCARCHDHKYDPLTQHEYYEMYAFFNNIDETGRVDAGGDANPVLKVPTDEQRQRFDSIQRELAKASDMARLPAGKEEQSRNEWIQALQAEHQHHGRFLGWNALHPISATSSAGATTNIDSEGGVLITGKLPDKDDYTIVIDQRLENIKAIRLQPVTHEQLEFNGPGRASNFVLTSFELTATHSDKQPRPIKIQDAVADFTQSSFDVKHTLSPLIDLAPWQYLGALSAESFDIAHDKSFFDETVPVDLATPVADVAWEQRDEFVDGKIHTLPAQENIAHYLFRTLTAPQDMKLVLQLGSDDGIRVWVNGSEKLNKKVLRGVVANQEQVTVDLKQGENQLLIKISQSAGDCGFYFNYGSSSAEFGWAIWDGELKTAIDREAIFYLAEPLTLAQGEQLTVTLRHQSKHEKHTLGYFRLATTTDSKPTLKTNDAPPSQIASVLAKPRDNWNVAETELVSQYHREHTEESVSARKQRVLLETELQRMRASFSQTMVMRDRSEVRETKMLTVGQYDSPLNDEILQVGTPASLGLLEQDAPRNRLALAQWITSPRNPLTARVTVNRFWQQIFGTGIVKTTEDFGTQGELPSHPLLLDWLATDFQEHNWDVKRLLKTMVMSATYRQSSHTTIKAQQLDPYNRLLSHSPRFRLPSHTIRDQVIAVSGLLVTKLGGPSVKPYQPEGLWADFSFGKIKYQQDSGDALYRRSLYTFWRRSLGPPNMFDEANRQTCNVRTARTNTPLHALTTLNDITYVEAARVFAQRVMQKHDQHERRMEQLFRGALLRDETAAEKAILQQMFTKAHAYYQDSPDRCKELLQVGEKPYEQTLDPFDNQDLIDLATYTNIANMIFNTDEFLTRE
ncbi:MAG: DUF1553 domain-containing protein [Planctomycetaceae bacterium]|nr:DUF1553 domain-containing protein [Planctomycetaceae bacterium]